MELDCDVNGEENPINQEIHKNLCQDSGILTDIEPEPATLLTKSGNVGDKQNINEEYSTISNEDLTEDVRSNFESSNNVENKSVFEDNQVNTDDEGDTDVTVTKSSLTRKKVARIDSDSEEDVTTLEKENFNDKENESIIYTMSSKGEVIPEGTFNTMKSRLATLCDSDSEDEAFESMPQYNQVIDESQHEDKKKYTKSQKRTKDQTKTKEDLKPMTAKEAADQRVEIQAESQRMLREKNVSLPYHKPKTHSLKEFLARRPKLASAIPDIGKTPPSVAIKMSTEQLELISKQLKIREKEVKAFYKSESEGEDDDIDDKDYMPAEKDLESAKEKNIEGENSSNELKITNQEVIDESSTFENMDENGVSKNCPNPDDILTEEVISKNDNMELKGTENECGENMESKDITDDKLNDTIALNNSDNYSFNLDDVQSPEKIPLDAELRGDQDGIKEVSEISSQTLVKTSRDFVYNDICKEIESFGENNQNREDENKSILKTKKELLKEKLANIQPKLSGDPDHVIDLDTGITKPKEVVQLMERFAKHTLIKKHLPKHKVELSIVTVESGGDVHKEKVAMTVSDDEDTAPEEKPGARLHRLKEDLQNQMALKKSEIWQQKASKGIKISGDIGSTEENSCQDEFLDDEDEEEMELTDEEEYSDEEMYDEKLKDKPRKKSAFVDDEAEVSENDGDDDGKAGYEDDVPEEDLQEKQLTSVDGGEISSDIPDVDGDSNMTGEVSTSQNQIGEPEKKVLRRIVQMEDDSDDEELFQEPVSLFKNANEQLDSTVTGDEDDLIPPHQPRQLKTPIKTAISQSKSIADFLTPISFLTSIQNLASATKSKDRPARLSTNGSPSKGDLIQKKLFADSENINSQSSLSAMSEQIPASISETKSIIQSPTPTSEEPPNTQDLLGICSGEFTGVTQSESNVASFLTGESQEIKTLGTDQDMIISQLLDEEELENFKRKFDSPPINRLTGASQQLSGDAQEVIGGGIIDSDDENSGTAEPSNRKKRKRKLQFSDDDDSDDDDDNQINDEEINLHDEDSEDTRGASTDNIGYDSEENEIDLNEENTKKPGKMRMADFLEAEAELSESEWGSEDEDEKGLDELEFEAGDTEKFDEDKMKEDLEKIHMRRILDDDTREVKMLQELLLDDGELHGTGRQRQFKWKNIDQGDDDASEEKTNDEEIYMEEEESEEQWRKKRHEREMFLKEKLKKNQELQDDLFNQSQLLQIGRKVLQKNQSQSNSQNNTPNEKSSGDLDNDSIKTPLNLLTKRGSFLSRSDQVLQRVAEYTKSCTEISTGSSKTTKHFVFQSVSALEVSVAAAESKKRKATEGTPNVLKKLRLNSTFSPALKKKLDKSHRSKKLFNF
ncbi:hypothetical protein GWI33_007661 [Rhynchophorus ferrugineus]|uniref:Claspin n=1 Tax=Rhynchophorus ferrugineus TaxID=354439 RepID=A0A834IDW8_RHYFE|nr:hypothetical protein GWI33_007661 [Rhynchophorus ferrugineus]